MVQDLIIRWPLKSLVRCFPSALVEFDDQILFYCHTQGIRVVYNLLKPAGNRVVSLKVLCHKCRIPSYSPLEMNKEYSILLDDWLIRGGGGYNMFKGDNVIEHVKLSKFIFEKEIVYDHPPVKYFNDRSGAVLLLWIFYVFVLSCVCYVFVRVCLCVLCGRLLGGGGGGGAGLLALVCGVCCGFVTFPLVSWVRCGT